jgi:hypothetical protein
VPIERIFLALKPWPTFDRHPSRLTTNPRARPVTSSAPENGGSRMSGKVRERSRASQAVAPHTLAPSVAPPAEGGASTPLFQHQFSNVSVFSQPSNMLQVPAQHNWMAEMSQKVNPANQPQPSSAASSAEPEALTRLKRRHASLKDDIKTYKSIHRDFRDRREEHKIVGFWADTFGGADLPDYDEAWQDIDAKLFEAKVLMKTNADDARLRRAEGILDGVENSVQRMAKKLGGYIKDSERGGERAVSGLEVVRDTSKMGVDAMSGGKLGALYGGVQQLAQQGSEVAYGQREDIDFKGIAVNTASDFVAGKLSSKLGTSKHVNQLLGTANATSMLGKFARGAASEFVGEKVGDAVNIATTGAMSNAFGLENAPSLGDIGKQILSNTTKFDPVDMTANYAKGKVASRMASDSAKHRAADAARASSQSRSQATAPVVPPAFEAMGRSSMPMHAPHAALTNPAVMNHAPFHAQQLVLNPHLQPGIAQPTAPIAQPPIAPPRAPIPQYDPTFGGRALVLNPHLQPVPRQPVAPAPHPLSPAPHEAPASPHVAPSDHARLPGRGLILNPHLQPVPPAPTAPPPPSPAVQPRAPVPQHDPTFGGRGLVLNPHLQPVASSSISSTKPDHGVPTLDADEPTFVGAPPTARTRPMPVPTLEADEPTFVGASPTAKTQTMPVPHVILPDEPTLVGVPPVAPIQKTPVTGFDADEPTFVGPMPTSPTAKTQQMPVPTLFPDEPTLVGPAPAPSSPTAKTQQMPVPEVDDARAYTPQEMAQLRDLDRQIGIRDAADDMVARFGTQIARFDRLSPQERFRIVEAQNETLHRYFTANTESRAAPISPDVTFMSQAGAHEFGSAQVDQNRISLNNDAAEMARFTGFEDRGMGGTHAHEFGHIQQWRQAMNPHGFIDSNHAQSLGANFQQYISPNADYQGYRDQISETDARVWGREYNDAIRDAQDARIEAQKEARFQRDFEGLRQQGAHRAPQQPAPQLEPAAVSSGRTLAHTVKRTDPNVQIALEQQRRMLSRTERGDEE